MGAYASVQRGPVIRHWDKELSKLFTSVKVTDKFKFSLYFLGFVKNYDFSNDSSDPFYFLVTTDGLAVAVLYDEFEEHHSIKLHSNEYNGITQISSNKYVIIYKDGQGEIITNFTDRFEVQTLDFSGVAFVSRYDEAFFVIVKNDFTIKLVSFDGSSQQPLMDAQTCTSNPTGMLVMNKDSNKIIAYNTDMLFLVDNNNPKGQKIELADSIINIASCGPNDVFCLSADRHNLHHISFTESSYKINKIFLSSEIKSIYPKNDFFSKVAIRAQKNALPTLVFIQHESKITAISAKEDIFEVEFPQKSLTTILQLKSLPQNLIAASCSDGSVHLIRFKIEKEGDGFKKVIETHELENFHHSEIAFSATSCELMFITIDNKNKAVIWEALPDWWSVPFYYQMFKGEDDEDEKENAV